MEDLNELYNLLKARLLERHAALAESVSHKIEDVPEREEELSRGIVALYFTAGWCAPCVGYMETIREVAKRRKELRFYKVDVDKRIDLAKKYNVEYLPAVVVLSNGRQVDTIYGITPARSLELRIMRHSQEGSK